MNAADGVIVEIADYPVQRETLHRLRQQVFVAEQGVPAELETDALDAQSVHALARLPDGRVVGTGRLSPERRIGRMAVARELRGRGVGEAVLNALVEQARDRGWGEVSLHAQWPARHFYARQGFQPEGDAFTEAGIAHQHMRLRLDGAMAVPSQESALMATAAVVARARRTLRIHAQALEPDIWNATLVEGALRRFVAGHHPKQVQIVVHDVLALHQSRNALLELAQRLPSIFSLREPTDPVDHNDLSACVVNDAGDYYARRDGQRWAGELAVAQRAAALPHQAHFQRLWERSSDCAQLRTLGI